MLDAAGVRAGWRVPDVAAGVGDQSLDIAARIRPTGHLLITDISAGILALAERKLRAAGCTQVEALHADAQQLLLDGAGFDAVTCRLGLNTTRALPPWVRRRCATPAWQRRPLSNPAL